jgi:hypothetical protein
MKAEPTKLTAVANFLKLLEVWCPLVVSLSVLVICLLVDEVASLYDKSMRSSLFTGFFTLSGFLLTAKTFIILNMKKEVYSTDAYLRTVLSHRQTLGTSAPGANELEVYAPLKRLGDLLTINVAATLISSALQFSLGLVNSRYAVAICLAIASMAIVLLAISLFQMSANLRAMYIHFEKEAQRRINELRAAARNDIQPN